MDILLVPNLDKAATPACVAEVCARLGAMGFSCLMGSEYALMFSKLPIEFGVFETLLARCSLVITIGGDGTIIHTAKFAMLQNKPVLGINTGRLGFLANLEMQQLDLLSNLCTGGYRVEERMLLEVAVQDEDAVQCYYALNDAVLSKGASKIIDFDVFCDGHLAVRYTANGVIVATPTGSTAYSLSAGGPIISPQAEAVVMTPICPHSLMSRSMVFDAGETLALCINEKNKGEAFLDIDGETNIPIGKENLITIRRAAVKVKLVNIGCKPFYDIVNEKITKRDQLL